MNSNKEIADKAVNFFIQRILKIKLNKSQFFYVFNDLEEYNNKSKTMLICNMLSLKNAYHLTLIK